MSISIWWLFLAFYAGLLGGIFITIYCRRFKRLGELGHF